MLKYINNTIYFEDVCESQKLSDSDLEQFFVSLTIIVKNENKDEADVSLQTILNASNSIVDKEINEIDNDNLIRQSLTGNTSIDYYN